MEDVKNAQERIEHDIARLAQEVQSRKERDMGDISDRQLVKEALESVTSSASNATDDSQSSNLSGEASANSLLPAYLQHATPEARLEVEYLVEEAFRDGLDAATARAVTSSPYILDAFRDALAGKLHNELVRRGLLPDETR